MWKIAFIFLFVRLKETFASSCGQSSIPFSFEALPNGQPVLGCARPSCFGWTAEGIAASSPATFYRVNKKPDGYFRKDANGVKFRAVNSENIDFFRVQIAECAATFDSEQCSNEKNLWVGGVGPTTNVSAHALSLQCCRYEPLSLSSDRGVAVVNSGQIVFGGEVLNNKRQYAFDYISDIVKHQKEDGNVSYEVFVRRLMCLPYPREFSVSVEPSVNEELIRQFSISRKGKAKAFQAPTVIGNGVIDSNVATGGQTSNTIIDTAGQTILEPAGERVDVIEGPFVAENDAIVQEVPAEQGFELPPGQVPQGLIPQQGAAPIQPGPAYGSYGSGYGNGYGGGYGGGYGSGYGSGYPSGGRYCFTADTMVQMANGKMKRMDELNIGDWVLTENNAKTAYSRVKSWVHRVLDEPAQFHRIELENDRMLKLTGKHFIYRTQCSSNETNKIVSKITARPVYAEKIQVGDCLYVRKEKSTSFKETRVRAITLVKELGIYSPMTENGKIVVNDILASCFNIIDNHSLQDTFFSVSIFTSINT